MLRLLLALLVLPENFLLAQSLGIRIEAEQLALADERVLPRSGTFSISFLGGSDDRLDLIAVDNARHVGISDFRGREEVVLLENGCFVECSEYFVETSEGTFGPDDEAAEMASRGKLEKVEAGDIDELYTRQIPESANDTLVFVIHNERTTSLPMAAVTQFAFTRAEFARIRHLDDVSVGVDRLEEGNSFFGLGIGLDSVTNDEGDFADLLDSVPAREDERGKGGGCESGYDSKTALVLIHFDVPFAPSLCGGEHASSAAHITEGGLSGTMGTSTANTRNTGNGATSSPGFGAGLVAGLFSDGVRLPLIFSDALMDLLDYIEPNWCSQDCREGERARSLP